MSIPITLVIRVIYFEKVFRCANVFLYIKISFVFWSGQYERYVVVRSERVVFVCLLNNSMIFGRCYKVFLIFIGFCKWYFFINRNCPVSAIFIFWKWIVFKFKNYFKLLNSVVFSIDNIISPYFLICNFGFGLKIQIYFLTILKCRFGQIKSISGGIYRYQVHE